MMCRVLGLGESSYDAWRKAQQVPGPRAQENRQLTQRIRRLFITSEGTYGSPRMTDELKDEGYHVNVKRVDRLMREAGLRARPRRRRSSGSTVSQRDHGMPDLVNRRFNASRPQELWVADITVIYTTQDKWYLAVILDVYTRKVVGWALGPIQDAKLVCDALRMAIQRYRPKEVIHHSDHGVQYASAQFRLLCSQHGIRQSMGSVGNCYDNAMIESWFATLKRECMRASDPQLSATATLHRLVRYIESWYNRQRRHSALGNMSPEAYERRHAKLPTLKGRQLQTTQIKTQCL